MRSINLRLWFPLLTALLFGVMLLAWSGLHYRHLVERTQQEQLGLWRDTLSRLQANISRELLHGETSEVQAIVSSYTTNPNLRVLAVVDDRNNVLFANRYGWHGQPARVLPEYSQHTKRHIAHGIHLDNAREQLIAVLPLSLPGETRTLGKLRQGHVYFLYDLAQVRHIVRTSLIADLSTLLPALLLGMLLVWMLFQRYVSRPLNALRDASLGMSEGRFKAVDLKGSGELAMLARSFDDMGRSVSENQRQLQESEHYNRMLFEQSPMGLVLCRMNGGLVDVNPAYARILGRTVEETLALTYWDITPETYAADEKQQLESLDKTGSYGPYEKEYIHKDGHLVPVRLRGSLLERCGETFIWSSVEDITERKRAGQELQRFRSTLDQTLDCVFMFDAESLRFFYVNEGAVQQVGYTREELLALHPYDIKPEFSESEFRELISPLLSFELASLNFETLHQHKRGQYVPVEIVLQYIAPKAEPACFVAIVRDITERKNAETELANYREHLEELVEERTRALLDVQDELVRKGRLATLGQLTATVSHELRNPLGAMRPSLHTIEKWSDKNDRRVQKAIERLDRNIDRCDRIIDELLDFTRITELDRHPVRIDEWLESVVDEQDIPADIQVEKDLCLKDIELAIDTGCLRRAIINVVENACHAMLEDKHPVTAMKDSRLGIETGGNEKRLEIAISDTGSGIPEDVLEKIFEPLFSTKSFGVGLGMPAVKQIMEQHKGGIEIETETGHGTRITLWLPVKVSGTDREEAAA